MMQFSAIFSNFYYENIDFLEIFLQNYEIYLFFGFNLYRLLFLYCIYIPPVSPFPPAFRMFRSKTAFLQLSIFTKKAGVFGALRLRLSTIGIHLSTSSISPLESGVFTCKKKDPCFQKSFPYMSKLFFMFPHSSLSDSSTEVPSLQSVVFRSFIT